MQYVSVCSVQVSVALSLCIGMVHCPVTCVRGERIRNNHFHFFKNLKCFIIYTLYTRAGVVELVRPSDVPAQRNTAIVRCRPGAVMAMPQSNGDSREQRLTHDSEDPI